MTIVKDKNIAMFNDIAQVNESQHENIRHFHSNYVDEGFDIYSDFNSKCKPEIVDDDNASTTSITTQSSLSTLISSNISIDHRTYLHKSNFISPDTYQIQSNLQQKLIEMQNEINTLREQNSQIINERENIQRELVDTKCKFAEFKGKYDKRILEIRSLKQELGVLKEAGKRAPQHKVCDRHTNFFPENNSIMDIHESVTDNLDNSNYETMINSFLKLFHTEDERVAVEKEIIKNLFRKRNLSHLIKKEIESFVQEKNKKINHSCKFHGKDDEEVHVVNAENTLQSFSHSWWKNLVSTIQDP